MAAFEPLGEDATGLIRHAELSRLSGMAFFERHLAGEFPAPPMCRSIPMRVLHAEPGHIRMEAGPNEDHLNPMGGVHGGFAMTVLDSCLSGAVHSTLKAGQAYATIELKVNLVRPIDLRAGRVLASAHSIHTGRSVATSEGRLTDGDDRLLAFATTTCAVFEV